LQAAKGKSVLFAKGKIIGKFDNEEILSVLVKEIENITGEKIL
jgi:hypothetical protein